MSYEKQLQVLEKLKTSSNKTFSLLAPMLARSRYSDVRIEIAQLACRYPSQNVKNMLAVLLRDDDWLVRCNAADSLGCYCENSIASLLKDRVFYDRHPLVRAYALLSLFDNWQEAKGNSQCSFLKTILCRDQNIYVRLNVYAKLYELGNSRALGMILANLNHKNYRVRCYVCNTLLELINQKNKTRIIESVAWRKAKGDCTACMDLYDKIVSNCS